MKLSKLFHTLYATVMALPVLIIPIFALNILHKENEPISIEVQEKVSVDFNQESQITKNIDNTRGGVRFAQSVETQTTIVDGTNTEISNYFTLTNVKCVYSHKYLFKYDGSLSGFRILLQWFNSGAYVGNYNFNVPNNYIYTFSNPNANQSRFVVYQDVLNSNMQASIQINVYDLTQMFGEGNEPSINEFNSMFTNNYYSYTESQKMLVDKPSPTSYNDTDIGSQFVYALYKPVNDYFNFDEYFGLSGMYDWFQLNIFNGTAPLSFFIVFNVMIYWLFISLFWLIFDILIYVPMVIHKWLDKAEM